MTACFSQMSDLSFCLRHSEPQRKSLFIVNATPVRSHTNMAEICPSQLKAVFFVCLFSCQLRLNLDTNLSPKMSVSFGFILSQTAVTRD